MLDSDNHNESTGNGKLRINTDSQSCNIGVIDGYDASDSMECEADNDSSTHGEDEGENQHKDENMNDPTEFVLAKIREEVSECTKQNSRAPRSNLNDSDNPCKDEPQSTSSPIVPTGINSVCCTHSRDDKEPHVNDDNEVDIKEEISRPQSKWHVVKP